MSKNILLLQGPLGKFNLRLGEYLEQSGCGVFQIAFNGGDEFFANKNHVHSFTQSAKEWPSYLEQFIVTNNISDILCFSDCRFYHKQAKRVSQQQGISFWVLEEGYLRPDFFTLEPNGVNALSEQKLSTALIESYQEPERDSPYKVNDSFSIRAVAAIAYYIAKRLRASKYPHYEHHRARSEVQEGLSWLLSGFRKWRYKYSQKGFFKRIQGLDYCVLVLQMHEDFQLREHSSYSSMSEVIAEVMSSFAENAPKAMHLVIKHHPIDRGFHHYGDYIKQLQYSHGLAARVHYVHDVHLPTLLKASQGVVTVNSTVGLSALFHAKPVKVMGGAIYDLPGLCSRCPLDEFWKNLAAPDALLASRLRAYLRNHTQINGSLYKDIDRFVPIVVRRILDSDPALKLSTIEADQRAIVIAEK